MKCFPSYDTPKHRCNKKGCQKLHECSFTLGTGGHCGATEQNYKNCPKRWADGGRW